MRGIEAVGYLITGWILLLAMPGPLSGQSPKAEEWARDYLRGRPNSGLVIGLLRDGEVRIRGYGQKSRRDKEPPTERDLFELGSLTHTFTVLALLNGREAERFLLEDPIQDYLKDQPGVPLFQPYTCVEMQDPRRPNAKRIVACSPKPGTDPICITFCDLASHSSGLPLAPDNSYDWIPFLDREKWMPEIVPLSRADFFQSLASEELKFAPGTAFRYSHTGMAFLGHLLMDMHDLSYDSLLAQFVTGPLLMPDTKANVPERLVLPGHNHRDRAVPPLALEAMAPAGGLKSNARDLSRFLQAHFGASPLDEEIETALQDRIEVHFPNTPDGTLVGYGWFSSPLMEGSGKRMYWQYGGTGGQRAFIALERNTKTGVILLANSTGALWDMGKALLQSLQP